MHVQPSLLDARPARRYRRRRRRYNDQPWRTALHEAGHAVVACLLNVPFTCVTIRPSLGRVLGHVSTNFSGCTHGGSEVKLGAVATVLAAGAMAEEYFAYKPDWKGQIPGSDYEQLRRLLGGADVPDEQKEADIDEVAEAARKVLAIPGVVIMVGRLAIALSKRVTLNHAEAVQAMTGGVE